MPLAAVLVWIGWLGVVVSVVGGWWIAHWCSLTGLRAYLVLAPAALSAGMTLVYSVKYPDATFGSVMGQLAGLQFVCALVAFAFVRHILQPADQ